MNFKDITKVGFYRLVKDNHIMLEIFKNNDENYPEDTLWVDTWWSNGINNEGIETFDVDGVICTLENSSFNDCEVIKETRKYKINGEFSQFLEEDTLPYKEKLDNIYKLCDKESKNGANTDKNVKFALKLLKIMEV